MACVIGVDIGTQSTKALLVDASGAVLARHSVAYSVDTPRPGWAEQWPQVWLEAVLACIAECVRQAPGRVPQALCVSSLYGGSGIPVDAQCQPLHPCLIWMDRRAEAQTARLKAELDVPALQATTGNGIDSYYGFTKMLWLKEQRPEVWARTRWLLPPNSYVNYVLTGELAVDHSSAGNIGGVYDLQARGWSQPWLARLGIAPTLMPERLVYSHEVVGGVLPAMATQLGLPAGLPVLAGGVDAAMATLAAGVSQQGNHVAMIGTSMCWGHLQTHAEASHGLVSFPHVYNGQRDVYCFGGALTAGASVSWFREAFCPAQSHAAAGRGEDPHLALEQAAAGVPAGADGVLFLPYLMGERSPIWDAAASGAFIGLSLAHGQAHLYRAVLEGVSLALQHNIEAGRQAGQVLDPYLIVVGGAARSDLWMQIIASVTGLPVRTLVDDVEAAHGAALLAARHAGLVDDAGVARGWVRLRERASPEPAAQAHYQRLFGQYQQLYPLLKPTMHNLRSVRDE